MGRSEERLDHYYLTMSKIHKRVNPDLRIGQLNIVFQNWFNNKYHRDIFYLEEDQLVKYLEEFANEKFPNW